MDCPKCGAACAEDAEECGSCGIVFARFQAAQDRAFLEARRTHEQPLPPQSSSLPPAVVVAIVLAILIAGAGWTVWNRSRRAPPARGSAGGMARGRLAAGLR
jgi:uncharacterized membrane protein YvbJ